eukprot:352884-Chlamydomonas_euryale.AAC.3
MKVRASRPRGCFRGGLRWPSTRPRASPTVHAWLGPIWLGQGAGRLTQAAFSMPLWTAIAANNAARERCSQHSAALH